MTTATETKPHISATQIGGYLQCGESYRRRYIERERRPGGVSLLKGKGFHGGAEKNFVQKLESHADLPAKDIVDAAVAEFETELNRDGIMLAPDEQARGEKIVVGEAVDSLAEMAAVHAKEQAPDYQPVVVEEYLTIELPSSPRDLVAKMDLADAAGRVVDLKTSGRSKSQDEADKSTQLTIYSAAYHAIMGEQPSGVRLDTVVQTKTKTSRQVLDSHRSLDDLRALTHRINRVVSGIEAGIFLPPAENSWLCDPRYCSYYVDCPLVHAVGRKRRAQND